MWYVGSLINSPVQTFHYSVYLAQWSWFAYCLWAHIFELLLAFHYVWKNFNFNQSIELFGWPTIHGNIYMHMKMKYMISTLQLRRSMQIDTSRLYGMQDFAMDLFIHWILRRTALSKEHPLIRTLLERIVSIAVQSFNRTIAECLSPVLSTHSIVLT